MDLAADHLEDFLRLPGSQIAAVGEQLAHRVVRVREFNHQRYEFGFGLLLEVRTQGSRFGFLGF